MPKKALKVLQLLCLCVLFLFDCNSPPSLPPSLPPYLPLSLPLFLLLAAAATSVPSDEVYEKAVNQATNVYQFQGDQDKGQFVLILENSPQMLKIGLLDSKKVRRVVVVVVVVVGIKRSSLFSNTS